MAETVFQRLEQLLLASDASYEVLRHAAVYTSEEAAAVRNTPLASGAKALVCKVDGAFQMFVLPADRKLDSAAWRKQWRVKSFRFADRDEVQQLTGLTPGAIPPFGSLFQLPTFCDERLAEAGSINFNAGDHSISISMTFQQYLDVEKPELGSFSQ